MAILGKMDSFASAAANLEGKRNLIWKKEHEAEESFWRATGLPSRDPAPYLHLGTLYLERKETELAEFFFSLALHCDPENSKANLGLATSRFHLESPARAVSFLQEKLSAHPASAANLTNLAIINLRAGDLLSGKNHLQNAIRVNSMYAEAFRLLGDLTKEEGHRNSDYSAKRHSYRYALASYEMYSKLAPEDAAGYMDTANLYFDIRDLGAAAKNYYKVLELVPKHPDARLRLAQITRNGGDNERAIQLLEEEFKVNAACDTAYVELGNIRMAQKDFDGAKAAFSKAIQIQENNTDALFGLGVAHHLEGNYDNALALFGKAIRLDPLKEDIYWQMGLIYQKQNNTAKAVQAFINYKSMARENIAVEKAEEKIRTLTGSSGRSVASAETKTSATAPPPELTIFDRVHQKNEQELYRIYTGEAFAPLTSKSDHEIFSNQFAELPLPEGWECTPSETHWTCRDRREDRKRDALMTISAKIKTPGKDDLGAYLSYLNERKPYTIPSGEYVIPLVHFTRAINISGHPWVESLQLSSEFPDFETRYLATVESDIGVLITLSVRKDKYQDFVSYFTRLTHEARVFRKPGALNEVPVTKVENLGSAITLVTNAPHFVQTREEKQAANALYTSPQNLEIEYQELVAAFMQKQHAIVLEKAAFIMAANPDYKETRFYFDSSKREKAKHEEQIARREHEARLLTLRKEVADLEVQGANLLDLACKDEAARKNLYTIIEEIYVRQPSNPMPEKWKAKVTNALSAKLKKSGRNPNRTPANKKTKALPDRKT